MEIVKVFFLAFIPIFVAVDAIGTIPIFLMFSSKLDKKAARNVINKSIIVAFLICFVFIFVGKYILKFLSISISDFMIAGGILLFILSIKALIEDNESTGGYKGDFSVVPLATPLITGPALLTTILILVDIHGIIIVLVSTAVNLILAGLMFYNANIIIKVFGKYGVKALAKISSLFLAAIAVMLVRQGILALFKM